MEARLKESWVSKGPPPNAGHMSSQPVDPAPVKNTQSYLPQQTPNMKHGTALHVEVYPPPPHTHTHTHTPFTAGVAVQCRLADVRLDPELPVHKCLAHTVLFILTTY